MIACIRWYLLFPDTENKVMRGASRHHSYRPKEAEEEEKKRCNTLRPDSSGAPLRVLLNLQWEQSSTACRPQKQGNHSLQDVYTASPTAFTDTHRFDDLYDIYTHTYRRKKKPEDSADDSADDFWLLTVGSSSASLGCASVHISVGVSVNTQTCARTCGWIWDQSWKRLHLVPAQTRGARSGRKPPANLKHTSPLRCEHVQGKGTHMVSLVHP